MGLKTAGVGHFMIPIGPAPGTAVAQNATANTFTAAYVQLIASTAAALFITGVYVEVIAGTNLPTYVGVLLATGAAASETIVDQMNVPLGPTSGVAATQWAVYKPIFPPVPVATATRIAAKTASSVASAISYLVTLECIAQSNVVDDGVAVGTVTTVTNQLTAAAVATGVWQDAVAGDFTVASSVGKALYVANIVPGAAGGHFIAGTNAATTITTGLTTTFTGNLTGSVASVTGLTASNLDATVSSRMATYTQPAGFLSATFPSGTIANTTNITAGTIATVTNLTNAPTAGDLTAAMKTSVVVAAWDTVLSGHLTAETTGAALNGAGAAGDPWLTVVPGAYVVGTAGYKLGHVVASTTFNIGT